MELSFGVGGITKFRKCPNCKSKYLSGERFILDRDAPFAIAHIEGHRHGEVPEIYFTCTIGSSWDNDDHKDNVTFACRYGKVSGQEEYACTLVDVPKTYVSPLAGKKLTRVDGLEHPKINEFWHIVDFLIDSDLTIHDFLHHPRKTNFKMLLGL
jgi:hypothetical protein